MKYSQIHPKTRRNDPKDAPSPGTRLLVRGGFIEQVTGGIWITTTMGLLARRQAERIVREEMNASGATEVEMPILHPAELWRETGRWDKYLSAGIAFHLKDRKGAEFILAPTAEEPITSFARNNLTSYNDLPVTWWQMSPKFRDELRPRQGLIRGREFVMKDAYSFDVDEDGMRASYAAMRAAYQRVFQRCGFSFIEVEADSGSIGGSGSAEFMAVTKYGEDTLIVCPTCHYGGNQEKAAAHFEYPEVPSQNLEELETPDVRTVEQLEAFTDLTAAQMVKTIVLWADDKPVVVSMRGDLEISEVKLANLLGAESVETADARIVEEVTGAPVGFAGPINLFGNTKVPYYFDVSVRGMQNFLCGANRKDVHFIGVNTGRDFPAPSEFHDLSKAVQGLTCSNCKGSTFEEQRGIELGHIFQLQQGYSSAMSATFVDQAGERVPFWMGCYGIGVSRIVQATVEQHNDERGIIWPWSLAPFQVVIIPVNGTNETYQGVAEELYRDLTSDGFRVLLDDRDARIGAKLTDAELLGWPIQVLVGRSWDNEEALEVRQRDLRDPDVSVFNQEGSSLPTATMKPQELFEFLRQLRQKHENLNP
ncbi:MAG: proline--tRNA ligase [Candidatus Harrisonbacteria bacterium CG10_big_fil_rev_8_21_14_0_10_49_15]|uniref:Proline--tRNA ligase n=1 Tax=Candidatus Harrisonbacteria bacterium CG10_big_fil_rev_8_21_14_0_10_49_15 TaxID=1974587 RepID=A0A2H0UNN4_9BACT|nr:MAG: proline--tRNA ligase [Candidatus Harrisonbacteria bacterium CG10_big_fil_rev_8_21_14_0_10_49_15]